MQESMQFPTHPTGGEMWGFEILVYKKRKIPHPQGNTFSANPLVNPHPTGGEGKKIISDLNFGEKYKMAAFPK